MPTNIQTIKNFPALIKYLRTDLGWPVDEEDAENLTFDYDPDELGLDEKSAVKVRAAKQLRPLVAGQPWGIFWIDFEPKKLPVTVMRRILNQLVAKKRGGDSHQATWNLDDLLFISAVGSEKSDGREITFAHFHQDDGDLPTLRVLGWDGADTVLKIDHVAKTLKEKLLWPANAKDVQAWREVWASAFKHKLGHTIKKADELAARLAELARNIRAAAQTIMAHETEKGRLRKLHKAFQTALIHDLTEESFADTYAQTITYGLLTAAISRTDMTGGGGTALVAENITDMVPVTNPFLKEMLETFLHAGGRRGSRRERAGGGGIDFDELGIQDVVELLRSDETDLPAILRDFNNRAEGEDPVIRFYEDFLKAYDQALKIQRGVFYTPKPAVSYIVRGVHELLQSEFGLEDGLADTTTWGQMHARNASILTPKGVAPTSHFVTILDPATGTATFLVEVIDVIYKTMCAKWKKQGYNAARIQTEWNEYVPKHLLPRVYGYELMMAPYAIAHMKIGLKLYETGYRFASDQRANIYLTNALEEPSQLAQGSAASLFEALGHESQAVNDVKRDVHFTVVIGNPPYANFGMMNKGEWILELIEDYKKGLKEKKLNLDDDFIKFMRFSQHELEKAKFGIVALITNNAYLEGITHRRMRKSLLEFFDNIYISDLHGNSRKQEKTPTGTKDENIFDIQQGVAIFFGIKTSEEENKLEDALFFYASLWGVRELKYDQLQHSSLQTIERKKIENSSPNYFFVPKNLEVDKYYEACWKLTDIFKEAGKGVQTERDHVSIHFTESEMKETIQDFKKILPDKLREKYELNYDSRDWTLAGAIADVKEQGNKNLYQKILYRPFDIRHTWYSGKSRGFIGTPGKAIMRHFLSGKNIGLSCLRQTRRNETGTFFVGNQLMGKDLVSIFDRMTVFPLYLFSNSENTSIQTNFFGDSLVNGQDGRRSNISTSFTAYVSSTLNLKSIPDGSGDLRKTFGPEDVFHYMYAVFHSPTYRSRYVEFLKIDFPRLPLTSNVALFRQLCGLGAQLVGLHLLEESVIGKLVNGKFVNPITNHQLPIVAKGYPKYEDGKVYINDEAHFAGIPAEVWEFHIGGYQVCQKWLKDRRERELSAEDIVHYGKVVSALGETIRIMAEVDGVIDVNGGWPVK